MSAFDIMAILLFKVYNDPKTAKEVQNAYHYATLR